MATVTPCFIVHNSCVDTYAQREREQDVEVFHARSLFIKQGLYKQLLQGLG